MDGSGLSLQPLSIAYSSREIDLSKSGGITIELALEGEPSDHIASVLSFYDGTLPVNLLIAQWKSGLLLRTRVPGAPGRRQYREAGIADGLRSGMRRLVAISSDADGTTFYLDGTLVDRSPKLILRHETLRGRLILGDSPAGHQGWKGKLSGLAIYNRSLTPAEIARNSALWQRRDFLELENERDLEALYFFNEAGAGTISDHSPARNALKLPAIYSILHKTALLPLWEDSFHATDLAVNILGFVPFGFFYFLYRTRTRPNRTTGNVLLTVLSAAILSTAIELIQVYLPTRYSQAADIVCNIAGAILGIILAGLGPIRVDPRSSPSRLHSGQFKSPEHESS